jgi:5-(carboxyamino)imidazole ribonucleotide synthase
MNIGIIGGGQLGRMLALAGYPLNHRFVTLEPGDDAPMAQLAPQIRAAYDDAAALDALLAQCDVVTYEFENVPLAAAQHVAARKPLYPPPAALEHAQDRLIEKRFFQRIGARTPAFAAVDSRAALRSALAEIGTPAILKTRRMGYDGKGQWRIASSDAVDALDIPEAAFASGLILEAFAPFKRELSILAVRAIDGATAFYPLCENVHRDGILRVTRAPAAAAPQAEAEALAAKALDALGYVGVLAIELFDCDGDLLVNEMAPRVHNSGHWTIEGAQTSQFENHIRAVSGLPLGSTAARGHAAMINLIGEIPDIHALAVIPGAHVHLYGKTGRAGRKIGHVTVVEESRAALEAKIDVVQRACALPAP